MRSRRSYEPYARQRGGRRSRTLLFGLPMFAAFAAFGSIVWLAYVDREPGSRLLEPPLIRADTAPIKLSPEEGLGIDDTETASVVDALLFEDDTTGSEPEQLLPEPERPLVLTEQSQVDEPPLGAQPASPAPDSTSGFATRATNPEDADTGNRERAEPRFEASLPPAAQAPALTTPSPAPPAPEPVAPTPEVADTPAPPSPPTPALGGADQEPAEPEPESVFAALGHGSEDSGTGGPPASDRVLDELLRQVRGSADETAAEPPSASIDRPVEEDPSLAPLLGIRADDRPSVSPNTPEQPSAAAGLARPSPAPATPQSTPSVLARREAGPVQAAPSNALEGGPSYRIQLAAVRDEADARRAWDLFQLDLGDLLANVDPIIERAETANGVFYRVQVGPFAALGQAERLCGDLKQRNASCFVIRR